MILKAGSTDPEQDIWIRMRRLIWVHALNILFRMTQHMRKIFQHFIIYHKKLYTEITIFTLSIGTDTPWQAVYTQIRRHKTRASNQGLYC